MKKYYVKRLNGYEGTMKLDKEQILNSAQRLKKSAKIPTFVALEKGVIQNLKELAKSRGTSVQTLLHNFITDSLKKTGH